MASLQPASGYVIETNGAADTINITTNGDGSTAIININGGTGTDTLILDAGVDLSSSTVALAAVETIQLRAEGHPRKFPPVTYPVLVLRFPKQEPALQF